MSKIPYVPFENNRARKLRSPTSFHASCLMETTCSVFRVSDEKFTSLASSKSANMFTMLSALRSPCCFESETGSSKTSHLLLDDFGKNHTFFNVSDK